VNLGVTTVLTMTTLIASTNAALPKVSYVKSIDVYLGACFFLVFTSLLGKDFDLILSNLLLPFVILSNFKNTPLLDIWLKEYR